MGHKYELVVLYELNVLRKALIFNWCRLNSRSVRIVILFEGDRIPDTDKDKSSSRKCQTMGFNLGAGPVFLAVSPIFLGFTSKANPCDGAAELS